MFAWYANSVSQSRRVLTEFCFHFWQVGCKFTTTTTATATDAAAATATTTTNSNNNNNKS